MIMFGPVLAGNTSRFCTGSACSVLQYSTSRGQALACSSSRFPYKADCSVPFKSTKYTSSIYKLNLQVQIDKFNSSSSNVQVQIYKIYKFKSTSSICKFNLQVQIYKIFTLKSTEVNLQ
jgi:hypothetical protein